MSYLDMFKKCEFFDTFLEYVYFIDIYVLYYTASTGYRQPVPGFPASVIQSNAWQV